MTVEEILCLKLNVPQLYEDETFASWVQASGLRMGGVSVATWHQAGCKINEYSDVFVTYDSGEGSDAPTSAGLPFPEGPAMPEKVWDKICELVAAHFGRSDVYCLLWLTNLEE